MQSQLEEEEKRHRDLLNVAEIDRDRARERAAEYNWFKSALRGKTNAFRVDGSNYID